MKISNLSQYTHIILALLLCASCKKQNDFLNAVPNEALTIPKTLTDLQLLLQNDYIFNQSDPGIGLASSDEFYVSTSDWINNPGPDQNSYVWAKDIYPGVLNLPDWNGPYNLIYNANVILDALPTIERSSNDQQKFNTIKGSALFFRGLTFYNLVQAFAKPYDSTTATSDLGIPLKLNSNLTDKVIRSSVQACYNQIFSDLNSALSLLPNTSENIEMPTSPAVNGLLSRIYLNIGDYTNALKYSTSALSSFNTLMDFNSITPALYTFTDPSHFPLPEMMYLTCMLNWEFPAFTHGIIDSTLYNSYDSNDLRKNLYFVKYNNQWRFKGNYQLKRFGYQFDGIATDELYLNRAECYARSGDINSCLNDLNTLLITRWKSSTFIPFTAANSNDALELVLRERRKELLFRGLRWPDLRRLNKDSRFAITLTRTINSSTYTLPPGDPRYVFAIPDQEIQLTGIQQNPR